jgi:hypothetical protein
LKTDRDVTREEVALLRRQIQLTQSENLELRMKIDGLEKEVEAYKVANTSLLHENGALKEWCERLVRQLTCLGAVPDPFVKKDTGK